MSRALPVLLALITLWPALASAQALPGVDVKDLDAEEVTALSKLMDEGACPCDTQKSLLACIKAQSCPAATELASYGAAQFREGLGLDQVRAMVVRKYLEDHVRYDFDLSDTPRKGPADAKIVIVEFADFECPHCALMKGILDDVAKSFPKDVAVYFKQFPLPHHAHAHTASRATLAAARQGRFWPMHDLIFANQATLNAGSFIAFATELGLNVEKFKKDMDDPAIVAQIERDRQEGAKANLSGTPTIYINGRMYIDEKTPEKIKAYITQQLAKMAGGNK